MITTLSNVEVSSYLFRPFIHRNNMTVANSLCWDIETIRYGDTINNGSLNAKDELKSIQACFNKKLLNPAAIKMLDYVKDFRDITINSDDYILVWFDENNNANTVEQFLSFRLKLKPHVGFTYNGIKFDWSPIAKLTDREINLTHTKMLEIRDKKKLLRDADLKGWANSCGMQNLKQIGHEIGCEKLDIIAKSEIEWINYGYRDVEILSKFILYLNMIGIDNSHMPVFVRSKQSEVLIQSKITQVYTTSAVNKYVSHGARCEAYSNLKSGDYYFDVNSEYPFVMSHFEYPLFEEIRNEKGTIHVVSFKAFSLIHAKTMKQKINEIDLTTVNDMTEAKDLYHANFGNFIYSLKVKITGCPEHRLHCFSFGYKSNNSTIFKFKPEQVYEIFAYEIMFLKEYDYEIVGMHISKSAPHFAADYIKTIYKERKRINDEAKKLGLPKPPQQQLLKILLNAGFGIFGARGDRQSIVTKIKEREKFISAKEIGEKISDSKDVFNVKYLQTLNYDNTINNYFMFGNRLKKADLDKPRYCRNTIPTIAIFTLSHARFLIHFYQQKIEDGGGILRYTDTDSILCDAKGFEILKQLGVLGNELGQLKIEMEIDSGVIIGSKLYIIKDKDGKIHTAAKGIRSFVETTVLHTQSIYRDYKTTKRLPFDKESGQKRTPKLIDDNYVFENTESVKKVEAFFELGKKAYDFELKEIHHGQTIEDFNEVINWEILT